MKCDELKVFLSSYFDGETDLKTAVEIEEHLGSCEVCRSRLQIYRSLSKQMKTISPFTANTGVAKFPISGRPGPHWRSFLAGVATAAACLSIIIYASRVFNANPSSELADLHIRSLQANHLIDIASSEKHTIKPWFSGKLDFSYEPKDFSSEGFNLLGGRLERFAHRPAMALVYQFHEHKINFIVASHLPSDPSCESSADFNTVCWTRDSRSFFLISDAEKSALLRLKNLLLREE